MSLEKSKIVTFCFWNQSVKITHFDFGKLYKAICGFYITLTGLPTGKRKQYDKNGEEMKYGRME